MTRSSSRPPSGDFGRSRTVAGYHLATPVSIDALGETWAGFATEGDEAGRVVFVTCLRSASGPSFFRTLVEAAPEAGGLRHPNLLAFLAARETPQELLLATEYLDGEPLGTLLAEAHARSIPVPPPVALRIIGDAIGALFDVHRIRSSLSPSEVSPSEVSPSEVSPSEVSPSRDGASTSWGGLSPETVFVASFGDVLLRHPGINEAAMRKPQLREHPSVLPYRAPEQIAAKSAADQRTDVYSAGVIAWEMLAGRPLFGEKDHSRLGRSRRFRGTSLLEVKGRIRSEPIPSLSKMTRAGGALRPEVVEFVERALSRDPRGRFEDLAAMRAALDELPAGSVGSNADVATWIDRVAGPLIAERHRAMEEAALVPLRSSRPPAERATSWPIEATTSRAGVSVPVQSDETRIGRLLTESSDEAPPEVPASPKPALPRPAGRSGEETKPALGVRKLERGAEPRGAPPPPSSTSAPLSQRRTAPRRPQISPPPRAAPSRPPGRPGAGTRSSAPPSSFGDEAVTKRRAVVISDPPAPPSTSVPSERSRPSEQPVSLESGPVVEEAPTTEREAAMAEPSAGRLAPNHASAPQIEEVAPVFEDTFHSTGPPPIEVGEPIELPASSNGRAGRIVALVALLALLGAVVFVLGVVFDDDQDEVAPLTPEPAEVGASQERGSSDGPGESDLGNAKPAQDDAAASAGPDDDSAAGSVSEEPGPDESENLTQTQDAPAVARPAPAPQGSRPAAPPRPAASPRPAAPSRPRTTRDAEESSPPNKADDGVFRPSGI